MFGCNVCIIYFSVISVGYIIELEKHLTEDSELSLQWSKEMFPHHPVLMQGLMRVEAELGKNLNNWIFYVAPDWKMR